MADSLWKRLKAWSGWVLLALLVVSVILSVVNSRAIHTITIQVIDAESEVRDQALPGIAKESVLPDYRIEVMRASGTRIKLGTHVNRTAVEPLVWEIQDPIPIRRVTSLRLVEDDKIANDVIEEVQIQGDSFQSEKYRYTLSVERTVGTGLGYFFESPLGMAILVAVGLAIFLLLASAFA